MHVICSILVLLSKELIQAISRSLLFISLFFICLFFLLSGTIFPLAFLVNDLRWSYFPSLMNIITIIWDPCLIFVLLHQARWPWRKDTDSIPSPASTELTGLASSQPNLSWERQINLRPVISFIRSFSPFLTKNCLPWFFFINYCFSADFTFFLIWED